MARQAGKPTMLLVSVSSGATATLWRVHHTVYTKLGNGTETTYTYDKQRERLQAMNLTADGRAVMENKYQYDAVDNILGIGNAVDPTQANNGNSSKANLGGAFNHTYAYDDLNRLIKANGMAKGAKYEMTMTFGRMSEPLTKVQKVDSSKTAQSYDFTYKYEDSNHPTAPTQMHELIHSLRYMEGISTSEKEDYKYTDGTYLVTEKKQSVEELQTIGLGRYRNKYKYTENMLRREHHFQQRLSHISDD